MKSVYLLRVYPLDFVLEFLLRREKGKFFKKQYPKIRNCSAPSRFLKHFCWAMQHGGNAADYGTALFFES